MGKDSGLQSAIRLYLCIILQVTWWLWQPYRSSGPASTTWGLSDVPDRSWALLGLATVGLSSCLGNIWASAGVARMGGWKILHQPCKYLCCWHICWSLHLDCCVWFPLICLQSILHHHKSYEWHFVSFEFEFLLLQLDDLCFIIIIIIMIIMIIIIIITLFKEANTQQQQ